MSPTSDRLERLAAEHGRSPLEVLEYFNERAAIREHDGGMNRAAAEMSALWDVDQWIARGR